MRSQLAAEGPTSCLDTPSSWGPQKRHKHPVFNLLNIVQRPTNCTNYLPDAGNSNCPSISTSLTSAQLLFFQGKTRYLSIWMSLRLQTALLETFPPSFSLCLTSLCLLHLQMGRIKPKKEKKEQQEEKYHKCNSTKTTAKTKTPTTSTSPGHC